MSTASIPLDKQLKTKHLLRFHRTYAQDRLAQRIVRITTTELTVQEVMRYRS